MAAGKLQEVSGSRSDPSPTGTEYREPRLFGVAVLMGNLSIANPTASMRHILPAIIVLSLLSA